MWYNPQTGDLRTRTKSTAYDSWDDPLLQVRGEGDLATKRTGAIQGTKHCIIQEKNGRMRVLPGFNHAKLNSIRIS